MYYRSAPLILALFSAVWIPDMGRAVAAGDSAEQKKQEQGRQAPAKAKTDTGSMTGCVDEQDGRYILVEDRNLTPIANLEAEGFPEEGFAKHVGNKVTVRGTVNTSGARPVVKVRSIEKVSDGCKGRQN